jgi:hypothetical protein
MKTITALLKDTGIILLNSAKICLGVAIIAGLLIPLVSITLRGLWEEFNFFWNLF